MNWDGPLEKISDYKFRIPKSYKPGMRVDGIIYADEKLISSIKNDRALEQVVNVAYLPGIVKYSLAMPDILFKKKSTNSPFMLSCIMLTKGNPSTLRASLILEDITMLDSGPVPESHVPGVL